MPVGVSAYVPLATKTLTATATSVTFSSISQAYRDLRLVANTTMVSYGSAMEVRFNADSGSNYSNVSAYSIGTSTGSLSQTLTFIKVDTLGTHTTTPTVSVVDIMDYSATDKHKSVLTRTSTPLDGAQMFCSRWANTAAITSIVLGGGGDNFKIGSTFTLYGIAA